MPNKRYQELQLSSQEKLETSVPIRLGKVYH